MVPDALLFHWKNMHLVMSAPVLPEKKIKVGFGFQGG